MLIILEENSNEGENRHRLTRKVTHWLGSPLMQGKSFFKDCRKRSLNYIQCTNFISIVDFSVLYLVVLQRLSVWPIGWVYDAIFASGINVKKNSTIFGSVVEAKKRWFSIVRNKCIFAVVDICGKKNLQVESKIRLGARWSLCHTWTK